MAIKLNLVYEQNVVYSSSLIFITLN